MEYQIYLSIPEAGVSKTESKITIIGNIAATCSMKTEPDPPSGTESDRQIGPGPNKFGIAPGLRYLCKR